MKQASQMKPLLAKCESMLSEGKSVEDILAFLRQNGCSRTDSIKVVMTLEGKTLRQAKEIVHFSKTWEDAREDTEAFHNSLADSLKEESEEQ